MSRIVRDWHIHPKWNDVQSLHLDPDCPHLTLEKPFHVGPGVSIGGRGFGYHDDGPEGLVAKDHKYGVVVKAGASLHPHVVIDRGSWRDTVLGNNAKLNAFSFIGHNVRTGRGILMGVKASISGSSVVGDNVKIWSHAYVAQHCEIGDHAIIGAMSNVTKGSKVGAGEVWWGNPAKLQRMRRDAD